MRGPGRSRRPRRRPRVACRDRRLQRVRPRCAVCCAVRPSSSAVRAAADLQVVPGGRGPDRPAGSVSRPGAVRRPQPRKPESPSAPNRTVDLGVSRRQTRRGSGPSRKRFRRRGPCGSTGHPAVAEIALVENEVDDLEHGRQALGPLDAVGHLEGDVGVGEACAWPGRCVARSWYPAPGTPRAISSVVRPPSKPQA